MQAEQEIPTERKTRQRWELNWSIRWKNDACSVNVKCPLTKRNTEHQQHKGGETQHWTPATQRGRNAKLNTSNTKEAKRNTEHQQRNTEHQQHKGQNVLFTNPVEQVSW